MYCTLFVGLVTPHGGCSWLCMWWFWIALGLEFFCFVIKGDQCSSSDMILKLFWLHVTSPQPHLWPSQFFCLTKESCLFKSFLQHSKTVALVQMVLNFKKEPHFCCCQNWSNQFWKIQNNARCEILELMEFLPLCFFPKNPKCTFSIWKGYCLHYGDFSLHPKITHPILDDQACCQGYLKILCYIFCIPFPSSFLFFVCCNFFKKCRGLFFSFLFCFQRSPAHLGLAGIQPSERERAPRLSFVLFSSPLRLGPACQP